MSKYEKLSKEELVAAIKARRATRKIPVDLRANEDKLAAALDADDLENGEFDPGAKQAEKDLTIPPPDATELTSEALQQGAQARADGVVTREVPDDLDEYRGQYQYRVDGPHKGLIFGLKKVDASTVRANKTHLAKCPIAFWDGTEAEFREQFDKV